MKDSTAFRFAALNSDEIAPSCAKWRSISPFTWAVYRPGAAADFRLKNPPGAEQAGWLGYPGTSGADFSDYLIPIRRGTGLRSALLSEQLVPLPHAIFSTDPHARSARPNRAACGLPEDSFVLLCFQQQLENHPSVCRKVWMALAGFGSGERAVAETASSRCPRQS